MQLTYNKVSLLEDIGRLLFEYHCPKKAFHNFKMNFESKSKLTLSDFELNKIIKPVML